MATVQFVQRVQRPGSFATLALCLVWMLALSQPPHASALGTTWLVNRPGDDVANGDLGVHQGSLRFALAHAVSGDLVTFGDLGESTILVETANGPLVVPAGVAVGRSRDQACGSYATPKVNLQADYYTGGGSPPLLNPVISLGAGATLRNVDIGGGDTSVKIVGANVDVCAVGLGLDTNVDTGILRPHHAALVVDGDHAVIHRNSINGPVTVATHGSDTLIGDAIGGSGEGNDGIRDASVSVIADGSGAAQRVTIRDPFPRGLVGLVDNGVSGGDDVATHANNWVQTPTIASATTSDNFATVQIAGSASPLSLVDVYFDTQVTIARQTPVVADAFGHFSFSGPLPSSNVQVFVVSTLNDPSHTERVGSSSQESDLTSITVGEPAHLLQFTPKALTFSTIVGAQPPPSQPLTVTVASGPSDLAWQTTVTTTDGGSWLSLVPTSGSGSHVLTATVDPSGLSVGTYHGSISLFEAANPGMSATTMITLVVQSNAPLLAATGSIADLNGAPAGIAYPGDRVRLTVSITNVGAVDVISTTVIQLMLPADLTVISGTGAISGAGSGFTATDSGFAGGTLTAGQAAHYTLDLRIAANARPGGRVISMEVDANSIVGIPVVGRIRINAPLTPRAWLPIVVRGS